MNGHTTFFMSRIITFKYLFVYKCAKPRKTNIHAKRRLLKVCCNTF